MHIIPNIKYKHQIPNIPWRYEIASSLCKIVHTSEIPGRLCWRFSPLTLMSEFVGDLKISSTLLHIPHLQAPDSWRESQFFSSIAMQLDNDFKDKNEVNVTALPVAESWPQKVKRWVKVFLLYHKIGSVAYFHSVLSLFVWYLFSHLLDTGKTREK